MTLPVLGLAVTHASADALLPLLGRLARRAIPRLLDPGLPMPHGVLASSPAALVPAGPRLAVYVERLEDLGLGCAPGADLVLTRDGQVLAAAGTRGAWLPETRLATGTRPVPPWVRARLRQARGLSDRPVLLQEPGGLRWDDWLTVPDRLLPTAYATAASVAGTGLAVALPALGWGAPLVTDPATCRELGAVAGRDVLVASSAADRAELARGLASDPSQAAFLSWRGRLLVEARHDLDGTAARVVRLLLDPVGAARVSAHLDALGAPADARVRSRLDEALASLLPAPRQRAHLLPAQTLAAP